MTTTIEAVRAVLELDATVVALVGSRIYPSVAPQGAVAPFVVARIISDVPENTLAGTSVGRLSGIRLQLDSYGRTYIEAHAVGDAIDAVVSALASPDLSAMRVGERDLYDDVAQLHCASGDYGVWR